MDDLSSIRVMSINPFWRWAIVPLRIVDEVPARPFYRRRSAERAAREHVAECPGSAIILIHRCGWRSYRLAGQIR